MSNYSVSLTGPSPWGFRLQGGKDFSMPLTISKLTDGGKAAKAKISVGDVVLSIDGIATDGMTHLEAQNKIKEEPQEIIKPVPISQTTSLAPGSSAYNKTARPFGGTASTVRSVSPSPVAPKASIPSIPSASSAFTPAAPSQQPPQPPFPLGANRALSSPRSAPKTASGRSPFANSSSTSSSGSSSPARVTAPPPAPVPAAPLPSVYNTPINLYSNENACEVAMGQRRGLLEGKVTVEQHNGSCDTEDWSNDAENTNNNNNNNLNKIHLNTSTVVAKIFRTIVFSPAKNGEAAEELQPSSHATSSVKTMSKAPAGAPRQGNGVPPPTAKSWQSSSAAGFPKAGAPAPQTGPSFGRVSSSLPKGPDRPAPQAHPNDGDDSLVQRAEHIPAGKRTPMCGHCNMVIRGPFLVAMGKSWHKEEFNCSHCRSSLADVGFVEERGSVYCERCYEQFLAPACFKCQQKILGEVINALKQTWHQPIRNNTFHLEDGQPYCETDYYTLFGTSCHGCDFPIEAGDKFLEALGFTWHDTCFVCTVCSTSLEGQTFFSKKDKPLCKKHAHTVQF
uniref:PDZ and LIM domain 5b n=1 Tax=Cyprinus carpio TaxID=7962 RepID=A0A8C2DZB1_CYPCA